MSNQEKTLSVVQPIKIQPIEGQSTAFMITVPESFIVLRDKTIAESKAITKVTNPAEQAAAIAIASLLKGMSKGLEMTRKSEKQPYWDAGKAIDAKAAEVSKPMDERVSEIEGMIGEFQRLEREKAEAAEAERLRLIAERERKERLERERLEKIEADRLRAEREAVEAKQRKEEAERAQASASSEAEAETHKQEQKRQESLQAEAEAEAERIKNEQLLADLDMMEESGEIKEPEGVIVTKDAPKAYGSAVNTSNEIEVTDIEDFYLWDRARREEEQKFRGRMPLMSNVKMSIDKSALKQFLKTMSPEEIAKIPGITTSKKISVAVRASIPFNH